jgi:hypothetical protein
VEVRAILICLVGLGICKNVEVGSQGERIWAGGYLILVALHMESCDGGWENCSDFVCFMHDVPIRLEALLDEKGGILGAPYYAKIIYVEV